LTDACAGSYSVDAPDVDEPGVVAPGAGTVGACGAVIDGVAGVGTTGAADAECFGTRMSTATMSAPIRAATFLVRM
jgi:hypothetical protein